MRQFLLFIIITSVLSCNNNDNKSIDPFFEGKIELVESRGYQGSLYKIHTTYLISENRIKREQKPRGLNALFNAKAGIIVDLEKDSATLYYSDPFLKFKHKSSVINYTSYIKEKGVGYRSLSPIDLTFIDLKNKPIKTVKDSTIIKNYNTDYSLYFTNEAEKHEIFDTKEIKIKRQLLECVFYNIPNEINFPLKSDLKLATINVENDTLSNNSLTKAIDNLSNDILGTKDTIKSKKSLKLKWTNKGVYLFKKGLEIMSHVSSEIYKLSEESINANEFSLPADKFDDINNLDTFFNKIPDNSSDFDD